MGRGYELVLVEKKDEKMIEVICPNCGAENEPDDYEGRPVRVLTGEVTHKMHLTCIMCGWERQLGWIGKWWYERYEKNYSKRPSRDI